MSKLPRLVFFGNERLATGVTTDTPVLKALLAAGYEVAAVVINSRPAVTRASRELKIEAVAKKHDIPVLAPKDVGEIAEKLEDYKAEAGVLVAYGKLVPKAIIDLFPKGIINLHPSLLPKYRGPTPIETAILDGVPQTGVSLMQLIVQLDAGPVYAQAQIRLTGRETKQQLANSLGKLGAQMMVDNLPVILSGVLMPMSHNVKTATYTKMIKKEDGVMDFGLPAEILERQVRAYAGWPRSATRVFGQKIIVTGARMAKNKDDGPMVMRAKDSYLEISELIGPSGKSMSGADFVRGYAP